MVAAVVRKADIQRAGVAIIALPGVDATVGNRRTIAVRKADGGSKNADFVGAGISVVAIGIAGAAFGDGDVDVVASMRDVVAEIAATDVAVDDAIAVQLAAFGGPRVHALLGDGSRNCDAGVGGTEMAVVAIGYRVAALLDFLAEALVPEAGIDRADFAVVAVSIAFAAGGLERVLAPAVFVALIEGTIDLVIAVVHIIAAAGERCMIAGSVEAFIGRTPLAVITSSIGRTTAVLEIEVACVVSIARYVSACVVAVRLRCFALLRVLAASENTVITASAVHT
jgi:hypothetical protein